MMKKRSLAILLCTLLCLIMLCSLYLLSKEASHACAEPDCPICLEIQICSAVINHLAGAVIMAAVCLSISFSLARMLVCQVRYHAINTLVQLKVKLTN